MNPTSIDWATHTWNPGYGCKRGCKHCYARKLHENHMTERKNSIVFTLTKMKNAFTPELPLHI